VPYLDREDARLADLLDVAAAVVATGLIALQFSGRDGVPRLLLTLAFTLFVPGRAIVSNWPGLARWSQVAMPMVIGVSVLAVLATATLWLHLWHPVALFDVEAVASIAGLIWGLERRRQSRRGVGPSRRRMT
jgi:hypothetical protein